MEVTKKFKNHKEITFSEEIFKIFPKIKSKVNADCDLKDIWGKGSSEP